MLLKPYIKQKYIRELRNFNKFLLVTLAILKHVAMAEDTDWIDHPSNKKFLRKPSLETIIYASKEKSKEAYEQLLTRPLAL